MAYRFKRKETTTEALRRLCAEGVDDALTHIKERERLDAVHEVRKEIKKLRALLRLMRAGMRRGDFRGGTEDLKEAARHFGPARDAHVRSQALGMLIEYYKGQLGPRPFADLRRVLRKPCEAEAKRLGEQRLAERVASKLKGVRKRVNGATLRPEGWPVLSAGIKRSYGNGRKAWKLALAKPLPENLHEWRKQAKGLGYQLCVLHPVWPEQLEAAEHELKSLGKYLGDDHDLFMLKQGVLDTFTGDMRAGELEVVCGLIDQRQSELRRDAMALGSRFYAEKAPAFVQRLGDYWKIWCDRSVKARGKRHRVDKLAK